MTNVPGHSSNSLKWSLSIKASKYISTPETANTRVALRNRREGAKIAGTIAQVAYQGQNQPWVIVAAIATQPQAVSIRLKVRAFHVTARVIMPKSTNIHHLRLWSNSCLSVAMKRFRSSVASIEFARSLGMFQ